MTKLSEIAIFIRVFSFYLLGGAILVSPPKVKYSKTSRRSEPPLGKAHSPCRHLSCASVSEKNSKVVQYP